MLPPEIATETVTRLRGTASATDAHGNAVLSWASPAALAIAGCSLQPVQGDETVLGRESVTSRWTLYLPPDADVRFSDRIRYRGSDYEVDGSVQDWPDIGGLGHKTALLRRVEG